MLFTPSRQYTSRLLRTAPVTMNSNNGDDDEQEHQPATEPEDNGSDDENEEGRRRKRARQQLPPPGLLAMGVENPEEARTRALMFGTKAVAVSSNKPLTSKFRGVCWNKKNKVCRAGIGVALFA